MPGGWISGCWPRWPGPRPISRWRTCAGRPASWKRSRPAWSTWAIRRYGSGPSGSAPAGCEAGVTMDETTVDDTVPDDGNLDDGALDDGALDDGSLDDGALDGNAIGGPPSEVFGAELTRAVATSGSSGTAGPVAELAVYERGRGTVVRCRSCQAVLMAFVRVRGVVCVDLMGLASLE